MSFIRKRTNSSAGSVSSVTTVDAPSGEIIPIPFDRASSSKTSFFCTFINSCMIIGTFSDYHHVIRGTDFDFFAVGESAAVEWSRPNDLTAQGIYANIDHTNRNTPGYIGLGSRLSKNRLVLCTNNSFDDIRIIIGTIRTTIRIVLDLIIFGLIHLAFSLFVYGLPVVLYMVLCRKTRKQRLLRTRSLCTITVS